MLPTIFKVGPFSLYSMGLFMVLAVLVGMFVGWRKAQESHIEDKTFFDLSFMMLFWGLVGARIGYIVSHFDQFGFSLLKWLWLSNYVGLSFWGGVIGAVTYLVVVRRKEGGDLFLWLDYASLAFLAAMPWAMMGMFLNGSYMGREVSLWLGLRFPGYEQPMLPIQLVMLLLYLVFFVWWWKMESEYRMLTWYRAGKVTAKPGFLWFGMLIFLGISFGLMSLLRADQVMILRVPLDLVMGAIALVTGIVGLYIRSGSKLHLRSGKSRRERSLVTSKSVKNVVN